MNIERTPTILLFGASSLLGFHLARSFQQTILPFTSPRKATHAVQQWPALQLHDPQWIANVFRRTPPDILLYTHAVCNVSKCEANREWAMEVNVGQLKHVLAAIPQHTRMVYVSSDHALGGEGIYTEDSSPCPISVYGQTRIEAEQSVLRHPGAFVIRAGLGIGISPNGRMGYMDWLRYRTTHNLPITIIEDEYRSAVWLQDLATRVMHLATSAETGIRHIAATRAISRVELALYLMTLWGLPKKFMVSRRCHQPVPHLGYVELASIYRDEWSVPLPSVLDKTSLRICCG